MFTILVVDDDKNYRKLMKAILDSEGYSVVQAGDGAEALELLDHVHADLAIVDIMMPGMDGYSFTSALREADSELPILMVSARQLPQDKKMGFIAGTDDYMTKPFDEEELLLRIKALMRRARIANEHKITIGGTELDYDSLCVKTGSGTIELPQKEFMLLYKLLSTPGKIFTRIQLMDEIWGADCETGWETVTVHIGRLRKRFEDNPDFDIVSVRGLGYKAVKK